MQYLVIGGNVTSKHDGDRHYISPQKLCQLYGLNPNAQNVYLVRDEDNPFFKGYLLEEFVVLRPRYDGNYNLPVSSK